MALIIPIRCVLPSMSYRKYSFCILGVSGGVGRNEGTTYDLETESCSSTGGATVAFTISGTRPSRSLEEQHEDERKGEGRRVNQLRSGTIAQRTNETSRRISRKSRFDVFLYPTLFVAGSSQINSTSSAAALLCASFPKGSFFLLFFPEPEPESAGWAGNTCKNLE